MTKKQKFKIGDYENLLADRAILQARIKEATRSLNEDLEIIGAKIQIMEVAQFNRMEPGEDAIFGRVKFHNGAIHRLNPRKDFVESLKELQPNSWGSYVKEIPATYNVRTLKEVESYLGMMQILEPLRDDILLVLGHTEYPQPNVKLTEKRTVEYKPPGMSEGCGLDIEY